MKSNNYGKIVNTTSASGLYGNYGRVNYGAAKAGLIGLTKSSFHMKFCLESFFSKNENFENQKSQSLSRVHDVEFTAMLCSLLPRNDEGYFPKEILSNFAPEKVVPLTLFLCHESCDETGGVLRQPVAGLEKFKFSRPKAMSTLYC